MEFYYKYEEAINICSRNIATVWLLLLIFEIHI